jgi:DNA-binding NarL/FixJ family response regulator
MNPEQDESTIRCRVVIADDHVLIRQSVRLLLRAIQGVAIVAEADDGLATIALAKKFKPDLLLLDVAMPKAGGLAVIGEVKRWSPATRVAVLTGIAGASVLTQLRDSGAVGLLSKVSTAQELDYGLRRIIAGEEYVSEGLRAAVEMGGVIGGLTMRERQVLELAAQGSSNTEIAALLNISPKTAENHRTNLMRKLGVHSAAELVALVLRENLGGVQGHTFGRPIA